MSAFSQPDSMTLGVREGAKTIHDTLENGRFHLVLGLSPEMNERIERLALRHRMNKANVLNLAVGVLNFLTEAVDEGKHVGIATSGQELETEITGLGTE
jgi:hypothetical protein